MDNRENELTVKFTEIPFQNNLHRTAHVNAHLHYFDLSRIYCSNCCTKIPAKSNQWSLRTRDDNHLTTPVVLLPREYRGENSRRRWCRLSWWRTRSRGFLGWRCSWCRAALISRSVPRPWRHHRTPAPSRWNDGSVRGSCRNTLHTRHSRPHGTSRIRRRRILVRIATTNARCGQLLQMSRTVCLFVCWSPFGMFVDWRVWRQRNH